MRGIVIRIVLVCTLITLCGCMGGKKTDDEQQPPVSNTITDNGGDATVGDIQNDDDGAYARVSSDAFESSMEKLLSRNPVSELYEDYASWASTGSADGGVFFTDMKTDLTYGFDSSDFDDFSQPKLTGSEVLNTISGTFEIFFPDIYMPEKENTELFLSVLFKTTFNYDDEEYSEYYGFYSTYLDDHRVFLIVGTDEGLLKADSYISITYQPE